MPQVIDEDTQHFRNRLEHLLNTFKTDAVGEFMSMKQSMLDYQKQSVKSDTQKYLTMYEEKHQELLQTKEKLLTASQTAEKKTAQVELLSDHIAKLNNRIQVTKHLSRPFSILYQNMQEEKMEKFKNRQAEIFDQKRLKKKGLLGWLSVYKEIKSEKQKEEAEQRIENEVSEIVGRFQKEMDLLKERLAEANRKNEQYESNKVMIQQNLKKAFLRGVCAMNMEAMGVLGQSEGELPEEKLEQQGTLINNTSFVENTKSHFSQPVAQSPPLFASTAKNHNNTTMQSSNVVIINQPKAESKDYKWKEAPAMGVQEPMEIEEPRMQVVKPTTEGKVIKVVDGKSTLESNRVHRPQISERKSGPTIGPKKKN